MDNLKNEEDKIFDDYYNHEVFRNLENPKIELLSVEGYIKRFGYMLTDEQLKILKEYKGKFQ